MNDIQLFLCFYILIVVQRLYELIIAKKNEKWMIGQGAVEFGKKGYKYIVFMHVLFMMSFLLEKIIKDCSISAIWPELGAIFITSQLVRVWAIKTLGKYWNTKIIVLPDANIVSRGPYRFIRHPNYLVVFLEMLTIPLLFDAFYTACLFTCLNFILLAFRVAEEEEALKNLTKYQEIFASRNRFIPIFLTKFNK